MESIFMGTSALGVADGDRPSGRPPRCADATSMPLPSTITGACLLPVVLAGHSKENKAMFGSHRFRDKMSSESTSLREMGEKMRHAAGDRLQAVREGATELLDEGRTQARRAERAARRYVKDRPLSALLV